MILSYLRRPGIEGLTILVGFIAFLGGTWGLAAQSFWPKNARFENLSLEQGLSQSVVNAIIQDRQGLLWFATQDGLNRYDGQTFIVFRHDPDNPHSLSDNNIHYILESRSRELWIGTDEGINRFNRDTETFTCHRQDPKMTGNLNLNRVRRIVEGRDGALWLGTRDGGLSRFDPTTGRFQNFSYDPQNQASLGNNDLRSLAEDPTGGLWVGTAIGLNRLNYQSKQFQRFPRLPGLAVNSPDVPVTCLFEFTPGVLWVGTEKGLWEWDRRLNAFRRFQDGLPDNQSLSQTFIQAIHRSASGEIWVATMIGIYRLDSGARLTACYTHNPADPQSLSNDDVMCIAEDSSNILWFGTYTGGVCKLDLKKEQFGHVTAGGNSFHSLSNPYVWSFCEDWSGDLWVGTDGGLDRFNLGTGTVSHFRHDPKVTGSLSRNNVQVIYQDRQGTVWVGTDDGLDRFNPKSGRFDIIRHDAKNPFSLSSNDIFTLYEDEAGSFWVGTYSGGLNHFDRKSGHCRRYIHDPGIPTSLSDNYVTCLLEDRNGMFWVGTNNGLNRFDRAADMFTAFFNDPKNPSSLSNNRVRSLFEDSQGNLWVGTRGGLNRFEPKTQQFTRFTEKDGLPNDICYGILEDGRGWLWISTNRGLSRFDPSTRKFRNYDAADGLQKDEFNQKACIRLKSGEMLFGGINGFTFFRPEAIRDNPHVPPVILTGFRKFGRSVRLDRSMLTIEEIALNYRESSFAFEFAALDFTNPSRNRYAYRLEGFDEGWIDSGSSRMAVYTNIDGGEYVFRVKAANSDGVWNETGRSLRVVIVPPIWRTAWFRVLFIAGLAVLLNVAYFSGRRVIRAVLYWRKSTFIAHFRTIQMLGQGGMGTVYKALNIVTKEIVALKVLNENQTDESSRKRFIREGLVCEKIHHPAIVQIFERGEHNDRLYYSMEFIDGVSLRMHMNKGPLEPVDTLVFASVLLDILKAIHQVGIIHRDIKPENIMLKRDFQFATLTRVHEPEDLLRRNLKLMDFGVAKFLGAQTLTQSGLPSGTVYYIPPEYLGGQQETDPGFDFYSLGMMLREMVTGVKAFEGENPVAVMYAILCQTPLPSRQINPNVPQDMSDFLDRLILKDPTMRLSAYVDIRQEVEKLLAGYLPGYHLHPKLGAGDETGRYGETSK